LLATSPIRRRWEWRCGQFEVDKSLTGISLFHHHLQGIREHLAVNAAQKPWKEPKASHFLASTSQYRTGKLREQISEPIG